MVETSLSESRDRETGGMLRTTAEKTSSPQMRPQQVILWLTALSMSVVLGMVALEGVILFEARADAWRQAEQASSNLVTALAREIARNIELYDLSIQGVAAAMKLPGIDQVSPEIRRMALFDRSASAEYLGSILVLNAVGDIVADSTSDVPHKTNFADRDFFRAQAARPDLGLFISRPFASRLRGGDPSIAFTRRISGPDGRFNGIVDGSMRLAWFQDLFAKLDLGPNGTVTLFRSDGRVIARHPFHASDIDRDLSASMPFRFFADTNADHHVGNAQLDGVERLYTYRRIGNLPLILTVAVAVDDVLAAWRHKAVGIGLALAVLCGTTAALCLLSCREILRRANAEDALAESAARLSVMATTDGLTGLANRRAFEEALNQEWRRAIRGETAIALLMLDADCFKLFNDRYGHPEGDNVLKGIATCIQMNMRRPPDLGARYGGEEFAMVLPETELTGALFVAERVRAAVTELDISHLGSPFGRVTVSMGVAVARPVVGDTEDSLVRRADEALYEAKRAGRNRVSAATGSEPPVGACKPTAVPVASAVT